jgi:hypothetical protein
MDKRVFFGAASVLALYVMVGSGEVSAHHSFAGYDMSKTVSADATIKEFRWGAPHSTAVFTIKGKDGKPQELSVGSAAPAAFNRQGFKPRDFKKGDKVKISWHPSKSGALGGVLDSLTLPDGRVFKETEFAPGSPAANSTASQVESAQLPAGTADRAQ